jgi:ATP-dependent Zn protease
MKTNRILVGLAGVLVFLSIVLTFVWVLPSRNPSEPKDITFEEAILKIKKKDITEVTIKQDSLELVSKDKEKFITPLDASDATREKILGTIDTINTEKPDTIKTSIEPTSSGWGWIVLLNAVPFFIMWAATLAVIVYAVRTLSRNKG